MTYNLLNFTGDDNAREGDLQMIIDAIAPDIIVAQEIDGNDGMNMFYQMFSILLIVDSMRVPHSRIRIILI